MYRRHRFVLTVLCVCVAPFVGAGCNRAPSPSAEAASAPPSPAESFDGIVMILKEGLESPGGEMSGFITKSSSASSRFQVHNTVSSKLIPPAKPDDRYRGTITVSSQSVYSLRRSAEEQEKDREKSALPERSKSLLDDEESSPDFNALDQGLVSESPDSGGKAPDVESVQRRADREDRNYHLEYTNGRWELLTKLDPETEASVEHAFDRALRLQP